MKEDKIVQISVTSYVNVDGDSFMNVYGLGESGTLYFYDDRRSKWDTCVKSPEIK